MREAGEVPMSSEPLHTQGRGSAAPLCAHIHTPRHHTHAHTTQSSSHHRHFTHIHTHHTLLLTPQIHTHTVIAPYTTDTHTHTHRHIHILSNTLTREYTASMGQMNHIVP